MEKAFKVTHRHFCKGNSKVVTDFFIVTYAEAADLMLRLQIKQFQSENIKNGFQFVKTEAFKSAGIEAEFENIWLLEPITLPTAEEILEKKVLPAWWE